MSSEKKRSRGSTKPSAEVRLLVGTIHTDVIANKSILSAIDDRFAVEIEGASYSTTYEEGLWDGKRRFFNRLSGKIATGLLPELLQFLADSGYPAKVEDRRLPVVDVVNHVRTPRKGHKSLLKLFDYQEEAVRLMLLHQRGVLELATNAGKTVVAAAFILSLRRGLSPKPPVLFIVPSKEILRQTVDLLNAALSVGGVKFQCGQMGDGRRTFGEVIVALPQMLWRMRRSADYRRLVTDTRVVLIDECHHQSSDSWYKIVMACKHANFRIGLSGTAFRRKEFKDFRLMAATGPSLLKVSNRELIDQGISAEPIVTLVKGIPNKKLDYLACDYMTAYRLGIAQNPYRNLQVCKLARQLSHKKISTLVLAVHKDQTRWIYEKLQSWDMRVFYNHGDLPSPLRKQNLEDFKSEPGSVMVATTIYDEGVDVPEIGALIVAGAGKSEAKTIQRVGRALRRKQGRNVTYVYDFADTGNPYLTKHSLARLETYRAEEFKVTQNDAREWLTQQFEKRTSRADSLIAVKRKKLRVEHARKRLREMMGRQGGEGD